MENVAAINEVLGESVGSPKNDLDWVKLIRRGFDVHAVQSASKLVPMSEDLIWGSLRIARRTIARRKSAGERLKAHESELFLRLIRVFVHANEVLGAPDKAERWLKRPNRALNGECPIDLLDTDIGFEEVMAVLTRLEHGVFS